ncbi:DNA-invertase hin (plasmid) [Corynebacterium faecale]|uniref:recombinase family protein n=1 Tax=Corynebacterium faecale TaxID=1758466 RepID=UPI0025B5B70C|nr:recombinase family protein [Corynebacterium faecale]WJY93526.1 DNA-invertase hin [Corynebacterium faecale]
MARIGTLLDECGRPIDKVQIVHKGKNNTRIKRSTDYGRSWEANDQQVPTDTVLFDDGQRFAQHSRNPQHATYIGSFGEPRARLRVHRVYKHITKAKVYLGENTWTNVQDILTSSILFDGGASAGWIIPSWAEKDTADQGSNVPEVEEEKAKSDEQKSGGSTDKHPMAQSAAVAESSAPPLPPAAPPRGQRFSYIRVSSTDQNLARQRDMIGAVDKEFIDEVSAKSRAGRPGLERCIDYLRDHDELYVASIDRLARSLVDLRTTIDQITAKGASVHFIKENLVFSKDSTDPRATLMLGILGSFAEFERAIIRERQAEGIALAKKAGKYKGRKRALTPEQVEQARTRIEAGESKVAIAHDLGVSRATLYRALANI